MEMDLFKEELVTMENNKNEGNYVIASLIPRFDVFQSETITEV